MVKVSAGPGKKQPPTTPSPELIEEEQQPAEAEAATAGVEEPAS